MKTYLGTKRLNATLMTLGEYNKKRGWDIPQNEDPNKEGYFVEYSDSYVSWSPKEVFEESYIVEKGNLFEFEFEQPHQQRVSSEAIELSDKISKLRDFINSNPFFEKLSSDEKTRLKLQLTTMECYYSILVQRMENF